LNDKTFQFLGKIINTGRYVDWAQEVHETWRKVKESQGWTFGPVRSSADKTNPFMILFSDLPGEVKGQNSLTPYAVVNFFRVFAGEKTLSELDTMLAAVIDGKDPALLGQLAEYIHSHFVAAQLVKGETVQIRDDMLVYEDLDEETKSWDTHLALDIIKYLRYEISK
jgi:hypothetical protein